ncbi:MAG: peptidase [Bacteroidetes bacterium]|nr:peptidase [Bacteroidota bacterium]
MKNNFNFTLPSLEAKKYVLDNGLKVYSFENDSMDIVRLEFYFENGGVMNQSQIYSSVAANSLISEGSSKHSAIEIANTIDFYGAFIEKTVDKETSSVCFYFLKKHQDNLIPCFEEIIKDPAFSQTELDTYLQRLRKQFLINQQKTDHLAKNNFYELIFGKEHPFGKIGTYEDFDLLERKHLVDFYNSFYSSNKCSIILSGNVDERLISLLNRYFGANDWKDRGDMKEKNLVFGANEKIVKTVDLPSAVQASIRIGFKTISVKHEDYMNLLVLNCLLGGYFGSRLMSNIREDKGYTYGISSILYSFKDIGVFLIGADVKQENCQDAIDEIYVEIEKLRNNMVDDFELHRVKNYMMGNVLRSLDGSFELADNFRPLLKFGFEKDYYEKYLRVIAQITKEEIITLAQNYLNVNQMIELRVGNATIIK